MYFSPLLDLVILPCTGVNFSINRLRLGMNSHNFIFNFQNTPTFDNVFRNGDCVQYVVMPLATTMITIIMSKTHIQRQAALKMF